MTLFTNGYITLPIPKGFQSINSTEEFVELVLVDSTKPMTIKVSVTPTLAGLVDIKESIEKNFENGNGELIFSDFLPINEDIYYSAISSIDDGEVSARCNEFLFVKDIPARSGLSFRHLPVKYMRMLSILKQFAASATTVTRDNTCLLL